jgi:hypothetical protein
MLETSCWDWRLFPPPNEFNIVSCQHVDCRWCQVDKFIKDEQPTRFMRNVKSHKQKLKESQNRTRKIFLVSDHPYTQDIPSV